MSIANRAIRVALYGVNGHQVQGRFPHPAAEVVALGAFADACVPETLSGVPRFPDLISLVASVEADLIVLCSPRRDEQAAQALHCLEAGLNVYAEKPSALREDDLAAILVTVERTGRLYREMAGTVSQQPYREMRRLVAAGAIGEVVQVFSQKCYPWHDRRPQDEGIDGGLALQVGVYNARFVEHVAGQRIVDMQLQESRLGNPVVDGECRMAASWTMKLASGGVACGVANYLNPMPRRCWGYEIVRIFGREGIVESSLEDNRVRLLRNGEPPETLTIADAGLDHFDLFVDCLRGEGEFPLSLADELSPTRWVVRARAAAMLNAEGRRVKIEFCPLPSEQLQIETPTTATRKEGTA